MNRPVCALGIAATMLVGCRSPTQISVTVQTDVDCGTVTTTSFTSGELGAIESAPATTESEACAAQHLGTVVLVPSDDDTAEVGFKVVTALHGESLDTCSGSGAAHDANCIVARRAIRYLPHTSLNVIVDMTSSCEGVVCDPQSTCVNTLCKSASIPDPSACEGAGCNASVLAPAADAGVDATVSDAAVDATIGSDGAIALDAGDSATAEDSSPGDSSTSFDALILGCDLGGLQSGSPWPMEAYCPTGRSRSPVAGPAVTPVQKWFVDLNGFGYASPSIGADGTIYVASSGVSGADGGYVGGAVTAVQPDGGVSWSYAPQPGASFLQVPVIAADSTVRFWDYWSGDYAALALDGSVRTLVHGDIPARGGITLVASGTMYVPDTFGIFNAYRADGSAEWSVPNVGSDYCFPSVNGSGVIFSVSNDLATALVPDGSVLWQDIIDSGPSNAPALSPIVVAPDGSLRVFDQNGFLWSLDPQHGHENWHFYFAAPADIIGLAVGDDSWTYLGTRNGLIAVDAVGAQKTVQPGDFGAPVIDANGDVYAYCNGTHVCAFDRTLANAKWPAAEVLSSLGYDIGAKPVLGTGGTIYVITMALNVAGRLHALGPGP